jgi:hypothetical protein
MRMSAKHQKGAVLRAAVVLAAMMATMLTCARHALAQGPGGQSFTLLDPSTGLAVSSEGAASAALRAMWAAPLVGKEELLSRGLRSSEAAGARNWRRLAAKLATPGASIKVVAFGGSVTTGHYPSARNGSWVDEAAVWLQSAFPHVRFEVVNLARGATDVSAAATCWYALMPPDADLVFIGAGLMTALCLVSLYCSYVT